MKLKVFLTVFLIYAFYIAPAYLTANSNRYIMLAKAVVDDGTFIVDREYELTRDWAVYNGHRYIGAAPGLGLVAAPVYAAIKPALGFIKKPIPVDIEYGTLNLIFALFFSVLPGAILSVLLYGVLGRFGVDEGGKLLIVSASAFGTILFYYSTRFMAHTMSAFTLFSAFYVLFMARYDSPKKRAYFLAGLCIGASVLLDYALVIGAALLALYAAVNYRKGRVGHYVLLALGVIFMAALYAYYHKTCFGNAFARATTYSCMLGPKPLSLPKINILYELTLGTYRGAFLYMPVLAVSVYGIAVFFARFDKRYAAEMTFITVFSLAIFFTILMFCSTYWPHGGDFGPRHLVSTMPFLMVPLAFAAKKPALRILFWITMLSVFINWCGVQYGDADNVFTDIGLFALMGPNSNLAEWFYRIAVTYLRQFRVVTHFSPFAGLVALAAALYGIWKKEIDDFLRTRLSQGRPS